jgi:hypothetical protein
VDVSNGGAGTVEVVDDGHNGGVAGDEGVGGGVDVSNGGAGTVEVVDDGGAGTIEVVDDGHDGGVAGDEGAGGVENELERRKNLN